MPDQLNHVAIVGAGLAGSLMAIYLAKRGHRVEVFERRGDPRRGSAGEGRSINLGLSARGIRALRLAGLWEDVRPHTVPMRGRYVHPRDGEPFFQPYGQDPTEILYSIRRDTLARVLVEQAAPGVRFHFDAPCTGIERDVPALTVTGHGRVTPDYIVGADGAFSTVRQETHRGLPADFRQDFLDWGYKELHLPTTDRLEALHVWPGERGLMVAHPNVDGSLTCTLFMPYAELAALSDVAGFFRRNFPSAAIPYVSAQFAANPVGHLVSVRTSHWHHADRVVLIGDACHAVYPFYGQGMNSAFEDCVVLDGCLADHPADRAAAFAAYQRARKPHTDVLADLSEDNFLELRDRLRSPLHRARKRLDTLLSRAFPGHWRPLYTMISHTAMPYGDALDRARAQDRLVLRAGLAGLVAGAAVLAAWKRRRHVQ
ncbi:kynurenine 3-monooxygenase [Acrocarpospora phusangensis]|uniref:Kynurenine 3-monooxygenase n=1 Tax=Acrocarpospora phusangensis TaxID=1070424 RepID=A0A919QGV0_9ACTN|nr:NAD(P)/FAD-dependent oxidoreductase [Acrocarpospora phusangensis]GIH27165.1 kynurenine 3-monooxygenase [Acrocarpospora phusangensis]